MPEEPRVQRLPSGGGASREHNMAIELVAPRCNPAPNLCAGNNSIDPSVLKGIHVACAYATGLGFLLRGLLALGRHPLRQHRAVKTLPHVIDTLLLASAVALLISWSLNPLTQAWLVAKFLALLAYIAFGFAMLRFGATPGRRLLGFSGGLLCYAYIVGVAHGKSPLPWLLAAGG